MSELADRHNPCPGSVGFMMFEHWEGEYLLSVASVPDGMRLEPGDVIIKRTWAPAGEPIVYNEARLTDDGD